VIDISTGRPLTRRNVIKGGLAAILAAGTAPSLSGTANASVGGSARGMMRNVGARNAVMFGGWKNPYVTDGLIAMWDGEWNVGGGIHDATAEKWKDIVGSLDITLVGSYSVMDDELKLEKGTTIRSENIISVDAAKNYSCELLFAGGMPGESADWSKWAIGRIVGFSFANMLYAYNCYWSGCRVFNTPATWSITNTTPNGIRYVLVTIVTDISQNTAKLYYNGTYSTDISLGTNKASYNIEIVSNCTTFTKRISCYKKALTEDEIASNYAEDKTRFNLS